jgi:predicted double-glycine peptidase
MILAFWEIEAPESDLRRILRVKPFSGAHPINLMYLSELGFRGWSYFATLADLEERIGNGLPCIVFLWTECLSHFADTEGVDYLHAVAVVGFSATGILVQDPKLSHGPIEIPLAEFEEAWQYSRQLIAIVEQV